MADTTVLALRYIDERVKSGDLGKTAARGVRYKLLDFAKGAPANPTRITRKHVEKWLERPDLAATTRQGRLSAIRGFCEWLVVRGHRKSDPSLGFKMPRAPQRAPRNLHVEEALDLVNVLPDARARLVVLLMLQEGLRCIEVSRAQLGDVDRVRGTIDVRGKGGGKEITRTVPMSDESRHALETYLEEHPARNGPLIRSYTRPTMAMGAKYLSGLVAKWMKLAGVKVRAGDGKGAHSCRHTAASDMVDNGATVLQVQRALGHRSILSTQVYLRGVTPDLRSAMGGRSYVNPTAGPAPSDRDEPLTAEEEQSLSGLVDDLAPVRKRLVLELLEAGWPEIGEGSIASEAS